MCDTNLTQVTQIHLLGFEGVYKLKPLFFIVVLLTYVMILSGNILIIALVTTTDHLKIPMFIFLKHLAAADIFMSTSVLPMMLHILLINDGSLTLIGCIVQLTCFGIFGCVQCFLIAVMSFDRYLAICIPLRYASLMNPHVCLQLVIVLWILGTVLISSEIIVVCQLNFCSLNCIDHFFCDFGPLVELSNSDKYYFMIQDLVTSLFIIPLPFVFIVITYIFISFAIMKLTTANGRRKAFSTCSSHLATVCTSYGTLITVYMVPTDYSTANINKYRSLLYIVVSPIMNPVIYSLRNQEIKKVLLKLLNDIRSAN
ncbi:olfactory receptor 5P81-like [Hyperolius riggenbachi]|uniref:olfactory receptor 5P81-like n=1 Tax=Hyperolius riggenbachi TaxID=752182 RepID=UPI0035A3206F